MNTEISASDGLLSEAGINADAEQTRKNAAAFGYAPVVGVVAMMAVALPLVFALRSNPDAAGLTAGGASFPAQPAMIAWNTNFEVAQQLAISLGKTLMIAFYEDGCSRCQWMDQEIYSRAPIIAEAQWIVALKVNATGQPEIARRYGVNQLPTIVWTDAAGNEKHRSEGGLSGHELYQVMQRFH